MDILKTVEQNKKIRFALTILASFAIMAYGFNNVVNQNVNESSIVGMLVGAMIGVLVAVALLPVIANQTAFLEKDSAGDLSTSEETLIGLWPLLVIVGVMIAIIAIAI